MTLLVLAASLTDAATAAAAIDAGAFDPHSPPDDERVLLLRDDPVAAEGVVALSALAGMGPVAARFDRVLDLSEVLAGVHPLRWSPRGPDLVVLEHLLRTVWRLAGPVTLAAHAGDAVSSQPLWRIFSTAPVLLYSATGEAPHERPVALASRVTAVLEVSGDALLREVAAAARTPTTTSRRHPVAGGRDQSPDRTARPALLLASDLVGNGLTDDAGERTAGVAMIEAAARDGATAAVWVTTRTGLRVVPVEARERAAELGLTLRTHPSCGSTRADAIGWASGPVLSADAFVHRAPVVHPRVT